MNNMAQLAGSPVLAPIANIQVPQVAGRNIDKLDNLTQTYLGQSSQLLQQLDSVVAQSSGLTQCQNTLAQLNPQVQALSAQSEQQKTQYQLAIQKDQETLAALTRQFNSIQEDYNKTMTNIQQNQSMVKGMTVQIDSDNQQLQSVLAQKTLLTQTIQAELNRKTCATQIYICYFILLIGLVVHVLAFIKYRTTKSALQAKS